MWFNVDIAIGGLSFPQYVPIRVLLLSTPSYMLNESKSQSASISKLVKFKTMALPSGASMSYKQTLLSSYGFGNHGDVITPFSSSNFPPQTNQHMQIEWDWILSKQIVKKKNHIFSLNSYAFHISSENLLRWTKSQYGKQWEFHSIAMSNPVEFCCHTIFQLSVHLHHDLRKSIWFNGKSENKIYFLFKALSSKAIGTHFDIIKTAWTAVFQMEC